MNSRRLLLTAAILGGLVASASAATVVAPADYAPPVPASVVAPTQLPRSHIGAVVTLRLNVDAAGQPSNIQLLTDRDPVLTRRLVEAVSQWQFSPARQNGVAVSSTVVLPLELTEG